MTLVHVTAMSFSPDGKTLATADNGSDKSYLWDLSTRKLAGTFAEPGNNSVNAVAFSLMAKSWPLLALPPATKRAIASAYGTLQRINAPCSAFQVALASAPSRMTRRGTF